MTIGTVVFDKYMRRTGRVKLIKGKVIHVEFSNPFGKVTYSYGEPAIRNFIQVL